MTLEELKQKYTFKKPEGMDYDDAVLIGNFVKMGQDDIGQTLRKIKPDGNVSSYYSEANPIVKPILENTSNDTFRALGLAGSGALIDRWSKMKDPTQRKVEEVLANLIEAYALNQSGEPFTLRYGVQF